jgi:hypothetical protein
MRSYIKSITIGFTSKFAATAKTVCIANHSFITFTLCSLHRAVASNHSLFVFKLRQRRSLHCAVPLMTHYFCLYIAVCGSGAVYIAQLHRITHYLSLYNSLRQRCSLHCAVTSSLSLLVVTLQFAAAAQSALRSYIK